MKIKSSNRINVGILIFLILAIWLSILSSGGCNYPDSQGTDNSQPSYHDEVTDNLQLLSDYLADAEHDCKNLENFKWQGLDNLGYREVQEAGQCCQTPHLCDKNDNTNIYSAKAVWIPILSWLPGEERISPVRRLIDSSQNTLNEINSEIISLNTGDSVDYNSLSESETVSNLFTNLDAALKSAVYVATTIGKTSNFTGVITLLEAADSSIQDHYQDKFIEQSGKYSDLLNVMRVDLENAVAVTADLMAKIAESDFDM